jgi:hypothetical protein
MTLSGCKSGAALGRKIDAFLKISIAASAVLAAASVGYYHLVYLPARDVQVDVERKLERARAEYSRLAEQARIADEKRAAEEKQATDKEAVQIRYQLCVRSAESFYSNSWTKECKRISDNSAKAHADCIAKAKGDTSFCDQVYKITDGSPSCSLPRTIATDLGEELEKTRNRCLQESRSGLQ